ncbi:MAG: UDP-N-acetylmuramoyl-tripeptide--D-alanyl-D-alanine ligase [bacterium]|nr:UDP-N-acetylmuramoyl-tripeptide--D-alanyl-D-alanine ligase [bacterium]
MTANEMAQWTKGTWSIQPTFPFTTITQDSRKVNVGALYVALRGERHDGHDFIEVAFKQGATAAMVARNWAPPAHLADLPLLLVEDPAVALHALAKGYRKTLKKHTRILGITGSAGKTTLKELASAMLSGAGKTSATIGNYNNDVGLPLSILSIPKDAKFAVIEAGISHPNDMNPLADTMDPDAAVISAIGPAHIEYFGSEEEIAKEKAKLLANIPADSFVVLSLETHAYEVLKNATNARIVTCSIKNDDADWYGEPIAKGLLRVHHADEPAILLDSGLCGEHNASNVLLAYAAARSLGISQQEALEGLKTFQAPAMRWEQLAIGHFNVINDAYNANPLSMQAALETFAGTPEPGEKVVCVGDMLELGENTKELHHAVGVQSGNGPWRLLIGIGAASRALIKGAIDAGYPVAQTVCFETTEEAKEELPLLLKQGDTLLLKGSRSMHLETLIEPLSRL